MSEQILWCCPTWAVLLVGEEVQLVREAIDHALESPSLRINTGCTCKQCKARWDTFTAYVDLAALLTPPEE